jgi:hypothetical protein
MALILEVLVASKHKDEAQNALHQLLAAEIASILCVTEGSATPGRGLDKYLSGELDG